MTQNETNRDKHITDAWKQSFANNLFKISYIARKVCFPIGRFVSMSSIQRTYINFLCNLSKIMKLYKKRAVLTCQFDVSKVQKQLRSVIQIHSDQSDNFGPLPINVCVTVSHNVAFNSINR